jgi:pimeloyl-ACP methyl ester carboxylesterase
MTSPLVIPLPDGRAMTLDDVGDIDGWPVVYLHGTPDSRLARHPDDGLAAAARIRLLAFDRPGYGGSDPLPLGMSPTGYAADVEAVLDHLGLPSCSVFAWSGGALAGLSVAAGLGSRVRSLTIASGLVPRQAYADEHVRAASPDRADMLTLADDLGPDGMGEVVAPMLAPFPCDRGLALEHQSSHRDAVGTAEVASVSGLAERMADALVEGVRRGLTGVATDVEWQNHDFPLDLRRIAAPVDLWWGNADTVTPPAFAQWYASQLRSARLVLVPEAGHYLPMTHWSEVLASLTR